MAIHAALKHETQYDYDKLIQLMPQLVRLRPAPHCRTPIKSYSLKIEPQPHFLNWQQDPFGNFIARLVFPEKVKHFHVTVDLIADMQILNPFDFFFEESAEMFPFKYEPQLRHELQPYLEVKEKGKHLKAWLKKVDRRKRKTIDFLVDLNQMLQQEIQYLIRMEPGIQTCEDTLSLKSGSCRDSAWLLVQILRHLGIAARFASGYLIQLKADVKALDGPSGTDKDFTDLHAWTEVYIPGAGWIGLDPTSGLLAGEGHIPLACTPDAVDAAPITGYMEPCESEFHFHMEVQRIHEDPRVTKPLTEDQWAEILHLGNKVDQKLRRQKVRLTMGGEPTFVSIDYPDDGEWNFDAMGPNKLRLSSELFKRLREHFAPGGLAHYGQGKWYPGEPLPRWALGCFWRVDGVPVWKDAQWLAQDMAPQSWTDKQIQKFAKTLCAHLAVSPKHIQPAYEDPVYYAWQEGNLPENVDPLDKDLADSQERQRLLELLERGLNTPKGYVIPLIDEFDGNQVNWFSSAWRFRRKHMFLIPGDSPIGYRLPLNSLQWEPDDEHYQKPELDPMDKRLPLPKVWKSVETRAKQKKPQKSPYFVRTSLCIENRNGVLYVFLPPLSYLEAWIDLIASIETVASTLKMPVLIEGYEPPSDWRLASFKITPDPGVIEVNIHPSKTWNELVHKTELLYEQARLSRLGTEKFLLDGRHTGTGGGNHVTIGGPTPEDSPFLQHPDLLKSLINFWQNHPSMSYLFSGLFIGPTSQAPRVDEARNESLYEMAIAFRQLETQPHSPWLADRAFRNLLTDLTGNTHRAEICIDKLFSPDSYSGRQGLVELRSFEMPPHAQMSLLQMLLIRSLVSSFVKVPYSKKLVSWGTQLHDQFMLPHYVWKDFQDVLNYLDETGFDFDVAWFKPFFEFRFPKYGEVQIENIKLELRMALEPWNVLGEEVTGSGTSRFVDSSVERLQVQVTDFVEERYVLTCNQNYVPLHRTGPYGEFVAGIRFKAWAPPSAMHPTIPIHTPLIFDVIDTWNNRSLGGCTYHVTHPAGRNYETLPINGNEAEARRIARFWNYGHTPGSVKPPAKKVNDWYPHTLDLREAS